MQQVVGAYLYKGKIFLSPSSQTTVGAWIGTDPVIVLLNTDQLQVKGNAVDRALQASRQGVPHPTSFENLGRELLHAAGVKSWRAFGSKSVYCSIAKSDGMVEMLPHRHYGNKGAHTPVIGRQITIEGPTHADLGHALEECLRIAAEVETLPDDETPSHT